MTSEKKQVKDISRREIAALLKKAAESIEKGEGPLSLIDQSPPLPGSENFKSLSIEIKRRQSGRYNFKAKLKPLSSLQIKQDLNYQNTDIKKKPKYKKLKKLMKLEFKQIHDSLSMNLLPNKVLMRSFLENSALMLSYEKYSSMYDSSYESACCKFRDAVEANDLLASKAMYKELNQIKAACHARYK